MSRPNILLLVIDSLRADALNDTEVSTPNLDRLADRGHRFLQCIATTTNTTPSFASILTGDYLPRHGLRGLKGYGLSPRVRTLAEIFEKVGYETHAEVTGPLLPETGVLRGFRDANHRQGHMAPFMGWRDEIVRKIGSYRPPWMMLLHVWEAHRPYRPPPTFEKKVAKNGYKRVVEAIDEQIQPVIDAAGDSSVIIVTGDHGERYATTWFGDRALAVARDSRKIFRFKRWWPRLDERFAGVSIGHGFALYEDLVNVPLLLSGPGLGNSIRSDQVSHVDILPTLTEIAGVAQADALDGRSFVPLLSGGGLEERPVHMETMEASLGIEARISAARLPGWKLMRRAGGKEELFDLKNDADERRDVAKRHPEVVSELGAFLRTIELSASTDENPLTPEEEKIIEEQLTDLGYL